MKAIGLILVIIGMGMAAAFGSQNADPIRLSQIINGRAAVLGQQAGKTKIKYCAALPGGERSAAQLQDGCAPIPGEAASELVSQLGDTWSTQRKEGAAAKQLAKQRKKAYCRLVAGDALTADQAKDGCPAVKRSGTEAEINAAHETWLKARTAVAPVEVDAQAKRAAYCSMLAGDGPTEQQVKDGCTDGTQSADVAKVEAARKAWMDAWTAVPPARRTVKDAYANLCGIKVDGQLISVQRSASCQPAKASSDAAAIATARQKWQESVASAKEKGDIATAATQALCAVAAGGGLSRAQEKAKCPPVPKKAEPAKVAELREKWQQTAILSKHANAAKQYAASSVDPATRMSGWFSIAGFPFILGLLVMLAGGFVARRAARQEILASEAAGGARSDGKSATAPVDFGTLLKDTAATLKGIHAAAAAKKSDPTQADLDTTKAAIEALQIDQFERIVTARSALIARYGMAGFAEVFGPFSGGERYVNRAWSSLVDMYWHECVDSLKIAGEHLDEASVALQRVIQSHSSTT